MGQASSAFDHAEQKQKHDRPHRGDHDIGDETVCDEPDEPNKNPPKTAPITPTIRFVISPR